MPTKNIPASNTAIAPSFRGGLSLCICLSKSSWSRRSIFTSPFLSERKRDNAVTVPLTAQEQTLGSFDWDANPHLNDGIGLELKKIKHQAAQGRGERGS